MIVQPYAAPKHRLVKKYYEEKKYQHKPNANTTQSQVWPQCYSD